MRHSLSSRSPVGGELFQITREKDSKTRGYGGIWTDKVNRTSARKGGEKTGGNRLVVVRRNGSKNK